ncbi:mannitol dehydrogenase family protein [Anaerosporobacter sp.]|uniref:mannitol dehydrogenase family protein n=1 Tax=Anaerosporobacter sp. TaxID=1872529 RepID=UPI00286F56F3|nr:mannitol dehydrogenase family protein [Anaerosporobacter sp.]
MELNNKGLENRSTWLEKGYTLPQYNRDEVAAKTKENPYWIHFGSGNIFRAFQANVVENLLNSKTLDRGLIVAEGYDYEIIEKINQPHDDYSILATLKADGTVAKTVVGSITESLTLDSDNTTDFNRLKEIFQKDSLQIASFTITEKGYSLVDGKGQLLSLVESDMKNGPIKPESYIGKIASLLYTRFCSGQKPIAFVSMDNCSHNGTKLYEAIHAFAKEWSEKGLVENNFVDYVNTPEKVSFPWSMIDKITPRPDSSVEELLTKDGIEGLQPLVTSKHTYVAPFVNAEECEYLVIEDTFPNGRPNLESGGVMFTDRATVDKVEKMKVCTCLNPLHTALAVFGCLLDYDLISKELQNKTLKKLVEGIGYEEGLPVVVDPSIINPKEFIDTVLNTRIPNPFMPDTPQRIATDTSQKLAIRFGETIKAYHACETLDTKDLKLIPLVFAGWLRYLMAIDDNGNPFTLSPDPLLDELCPYVANIKLGDSVNVADTLKPILSNESIFGVNLYDMNLASLVCDYFSEMITGIGAVHKALERYV